MVLTNKQKDRFDQQITLFLKGGQNNPRSLTNHYAIEGKTYHFKWASTDLSAEAEQLQLIDNKLRNDEIQVIKLVHFEKNKNVLITEHIEGNSCFNVIWNKFSYLDFWRNQDIPWEKKLIELIQWLHNYHNLTDNLNTSEVNKKYCELLRGKMMSKLKCIENSQHNPFDHRQCQLITSFIRNNIDDSSWRLQPVHIIHADITLTNILIDSNNQFYILDFGDSHAGFAIEDFVQLWCCIWEISEQSLKKKKYLDPILQEMIVTYNDQQKAKKSPTLDLTNPSFKMLRLYRGLIRINEGCQDYIKNNTYSFSTRFTHNKLMSSHSRYIFDLINE